MVAKITIDRQDALNALNKEVMEELEETLNNIFSDDVRCIVVTGAGTKAFVAGADIGSMQHMTKEEATKWSQFGNAVFLKLEQLCVPSIAAVNGYALGGGCELALACDIRIASENAVFSQPEVALGITAGFGGTQRLPKLVGCGVAKELLYSGARIDAKEAHRIGLVNHVYSGDVLIGKAMELAKKIAGNSPIGVRSTKAAINMGTLSNENGFEIESTLFGNCFQTEDQVNAMTAFLEKKKLDSFKNK